MKNKVRPIDANALAKRIREYMDNFPYAGTRLATCRVVLSMLGDEGQTPTLTDHFPDLTNMIPLTLEQLREMDGEPVWIVEAPHWGHWELSEDAEDYIIDRHEEFYGLKYNDPEGKHGLHKLGWLAYAYPPAHIDREAWKSCKLCEKYKVFQFNAWEKPEMSLGNIDCMGTSLFCPHCGRPLTDEAVEMVMDRMEAVYGQASD